MTIQRTEQRDSFYTGETSQPKRKDSIIWRGFLVVFNFFYETPAKVIGIAVAGVACHFFCPNLAPFFLALAATTLASKLVVKCLSRYKIKQIENIERKACQLAENHPIIRLIVFVSLAVAAFFFPIPGLIVGCCLGVFNGIVIEFEYYKKVQQVKRFHHETDIPKGVTQIAIA